MELLLDEIESPLGNIILGEADGALCALYFADFRSRMLSQLETLHGPVHPKKTSTPSQSSVRLDAYFEGDLAALDALKVHTGGTPFQQAVWSALLRVRAGTTATYGELAAWLGRPQAARAVGAAVGQNPVSIVLPCHRIVGANGSLTGYGGGLERKRWLLQHEGVSLPKSRRETPSRQEPFASLGFAV